jgi:hypothetical protein
MKSHTASAPWAAHMSASTNGLATLMSVNSTSASPASTVSPAVLATAMPNVSGSTDASFG